MAMSFNIGRISSVALLSVAMSGCSFAPKYEQPEAPIASHWPGQADAPTRSPVTLAMANLVSDKELLNLVNIALENNRDLRKALLNVEAARASYGARRADLLPTVGVQSSALRQRTSAGLSQTGVATTTSFYQAGFGITSFELDLFGRVRNLSESAQQDYFAIEQNAQTLRISLVAEVAQSYIARLISRARLDLTRRTLEARERTLGLMRERHALGAATAVEFEDALGLAEEARADVEQVQRELRQADNALRLLMGASEAHIESTRVTELERVFAVRDIGAGAPSDLIRDRPDIMAAESALRARYADIGAARAAFFPNVSLTAFLGASSPQLSSLLGSGRDSWSFAPQMTLPIFDGGRNQANLDLAHARRDVAVAAYEGTIQTAFREVADALAANDTLRREVRHRRALLDSSRKSLALAEARYKGGLDSNLRYLDAQRVTYSNEIAYINIVGQQQMAIVSLFKALGGRWYVA